MYLTYDSGLVRQGFTLYQALRGRLIGDLPGGILPIAARIMISVAVAVEHRK